MIFLAWIKIKVMSVPKILLSLVLCFGLGVSKNVTYLARAQNTEAVPIGMGKSIDNYLSRIEALGFSGAIVVSKKDKIILSKGYGYADRENRIIFTPQTVQSNGSNTKQFTGAAILLLQSRHQLSVNDSLPLYFDNVPKDKQQITLHQLLTHSSGLVSGVGPDDEAITFETFFKRIMKEPLKFESGTAYNYSNAGYSILGKVIEKAAGVNYETFLNENLLAPMEMENTGYVIPKWVEENMAIGYRKGQKWGKVFKKGWIRDGPNWHLRANGGLHTTTEDMLRWSRMLAGQGVLDEKDIEIWTTGYVPESNGYSKYGYGLVTYDDPKWGKVVTHSGSNGIFTSEFFWLPEKDFFFYIHGNSSIVPVYTLQDNILKAAFEGSFKFPRKIGSDLSIMPVTVRKKEGRYYNETGSIELMADDIRLIGKLYGQSTFDLLLEHSTEQKAEFENLNSTTREVMKRLELGDENAFENLVPNNVDSRDFTGLFLDRIQRMGDLQSLTVIGTFENTYGSKFYEYGPYTTFVYAKFKHWNQYWNLVWNEDGKYKGNYSGPWPEFTFIPVGNGKFIGMRGVYPWNTINAQFHRECLFIKQASFCLREY